MLPSAGSDRSELEALIDERIRVALRDNMIRVEARALSIPLSKLSGDAATIGQLVQWDGERWVAGDGMREVFVQQEEPATDAPAYLWVETNADGDPIGLWVGP